MRKITWDNPWPFSSCLATDAAIAPRPRFTCGVDRLYPLPLTHFPIAVAATTSSAEPLLNILLSFCFPWNTFVFETRLDTGQGWSVREAIALVVRVTEGVLETYLAALVTLTPTSKLLGTGDLLAEITLPPHRYP